MYESLLQSRSTQNNIFFGWWYQLLSTEHSDTLPFISYFFKDIFAIPLDLANISQTYLWIKHLISV